MFRVFGWIRQHLLLIIIPVVVGAASVPSYYFYQQYRSTALKLQKLSQTTQESAKAIVTAVGTLMVLPNDEDPTIATVTDKDKIKNQPFFANALNGDKVLIYTKAKKAILYRPTINKIIEVGPIAIGSQDASASAAQTISMALYNGTRDASRLNIFETALKKKVPNAEVTEHIPARRTYGNTVIIDVQNDKPGEVTALAQTLGITVASMPEGEATPAADFLIIVGTDAK